MPNSRYPDRTATQRQRRRTERLAAEGLKKVHVIVPVSREDDIKEIAREMREEQEMESYSIINREVANLRGVDSIHFDIYKDLNDRSGVLKIGEGWYPMDRQSTEISNQDIIKHWLQSH